MVHVPQVNAYTDLSLEFSSEELFEAQHSCYDEFYHRYRTSSETSSTYLQRVPE